MSDQGTQPKTGEGVATRPPLPPFTRADRHSKGSPGVKGKALDGSIDKISAFVLRYGLVLVVFWIGCLKFTAYESKGVFNHASHSPLLAWAYHILDV